MRGRRLNQVLIRSIKNNPAQIMENIKVTQLNDELDKAIKGIEDNNLDQTDAALSKFVQIWPYVEGKFKQKRFIIYYN